MFKFFHFPVGLFVYFVSNLQALQLGQDLSSPYGFLSGQRCQICLRSDSLHKVMERLANPGKWCSLFPPLIQKKKKQEKVWKS